MFRKLRKAIKKLPLVAKAASLGMVVALIPVMAFAYGPARPTFDYNKYDPTDPTCRAASNDHGRCGSMNGPVFNSFVNVPNYGDERAFTRISVANPGDTNPVDNDYRHELVAQPGQEYWMRIYVHNNANTQTNNEDLNHDGFPDGVARNTRVKLSYLTGRANAFDLKATVTADNAATVWDEAVLRDNNDQFRVEYVPGSAKVLNTAQPNVLRDLNDDPTDADGLLLGYNQMDGKQPGCFEYVNRVYVKVVVKAPKILVKKVAFKSGTQDRLDDKIVNQDTHITYKSFYYNIGNDVANDVTLRDTLPAGTDYVANTLKWYTLHQNGVVQTSTQEKAFFHQGGINLGNYAPLTDAQRAQVLANHGDPSLDPYSGLLTYRVNITPDKKICTLTNTVFARVPGGREKSSKSTVKVNRTCKETPVKPAKLVNTGPGDVLGIFAATTVAGAMLYRLRLLHKVDR